MVVQSVMLVEDVSSADFLSDCSLREGLRHLLCCTNGRKGIPKETALKLFPWRDITASDAPPASGRKFSTAVGENWPTTTMA